MSGLDFDLALDHLETAFDISPEHRGIKKIWDIVILGLANLMKRKLS